MIMSMALPRRPRLRRRARLEADAVEDERVAGENEEEQDALEDLGDLVGDAERDLRALAADDSSAPAASPATSTPIGLSRPRKATMMAVKP